jgi:hypothetical protein
VQKLSRVIRKLRKYGSHCLFIGIVSTVSGPVNQLMFTKVSASWVTAPLTTFRRPIAEMGAAALRLLLRVRTGEQPEARRGELVTSLVVRDSTAPLAAALHRSG